MDNPSIAKWRVDSNAHPSPFYEEGGAHEHSSDSSYSMYDQPGYANGDLERIIGCTFVIANEQVIGEVLWSRQYTIGEHGPSSQYQYMIDNTVTEIPDWAIHCLNDEYQLNASVVDDDAGEQRAYAIPDFLARAPLAQNAMEAQISMSQELQKLPAPPNWILREDPMFSVLMTPPAIATHAEEKEEDLIQLLFTEKQQKIFEHRPYHMIFSPLQLKLKMIYQTYPAPGLPSESKRRIDC